MGQKLREQWIATENIARFERQISSEADTCQRKLLEGLLAMEPQKLRAILNSGGGRDGLED